MTVALPMTRSTRQTFSYLQGWVHFKAVFAITIRLLLPDFPGQPPKYVKPVGSNDTRYFELIENYAHIIAPVVVITVVALVSFTIITVWRRKDIERSTKAELKREIVRQLRREVYGMGAARLAQLLGADEDVMLNVLEEMAEDNMVELYADSSGHASWRMKGLLT